MSISGVGSSMASAMQSAMQANRPQKPDASAMAADVFAMLDSSGKGYIDSSDLAGALESTGSSASAEDLLGAMDGDGDGKVTEQELGSLLQKVADQLEDSFGASRVGQAMGNRPPPPPPPPAGEDEGMSVEQLGAMAEEAEASGSAEASELAALVESFDEADTDGDGKVSFQEAMAFRESEEAASGASSDSRPPPPDETARDERMLARVLQMLQEYTGDSSTASTGSTLSVSA
ncbi:EF-hand domain-containing protein [Methyloversatilis sp. MC4-4]|uniref:EF-hand domain-containing protein n=1 Tax=Methyloversatilis sp. MC4-4 TaxID=3132824 RepID=UPI003CEABD27